MSLPVVAVGMQGGMGGGGGVGGGVSHVNGLVTPVTSILSNSWTLVQFRPSSLHFYIVMIIKHHLTKMVMATIGMGWGGGCTSIRLPLAIYKVTPGDQNTWSLAS